MIAGTNGCVSLIVSKIAEASAETPGVARFRSLPIGGFQGKEAIRERCFPVKVAGIAFVVFLRELHRHGAAYESLVVHARAPSSLCLHACDTRPTPENTLYTAHLT